MKNYIIFYTTLIAFVIGGIKWTSYTIEKAKKEKFEQTNHHEQLSKMLMASGQVNPADFANKNIIIYYWTEGCDNCIKEYPKLDELASKNKENTIVYLATNNNKEDAEAYFNKKKIKTSLPCIFEQREILSNYLDLLSEYFYSKEELNTLDQRSQLSLLVSKDGKVKHFKIGEDKNRISELEKALQ